MAGPTLQVQAPSRAPREGGISSVAEFRENDRIALAEDVVFQSDGCDFPQTEEVRCYATETPDAKTATGVDIVDAIDVPFTLYAASQCFAGPDADYAERARRTLDEGRDQEVEERLGAWAAGGTALSAGTTAKEAVARVDQGIDAGYRGRGIILMSRFDADLAGLEYKNGEPLRTKTGTPVVASGRIAPGTVYGLGAVAVDHTSVLERDVIKPDTNTHWALAEQALAIVVDCAFRVKSAITPA